MANSFFSILASGRVMDMNSLVAGIFFGIIGSGYFMYGRKAQNPLALVSGVLLCVFPYFVDGFVWTMVVGVALLALPFVMTW